MDASRSFSGQAVVAPGTLGPCLRPFFSYYGSKHELAPQYPRPVHPLIVEPFAGGAGYAHRYSAHRVVLIEKDETVAALWSYLIRVSEEEILALPDEVLHVADIKGAAPEARLLVGYWLGRALQQPRETAGSWVRRYARQPGYASSFWGPVVKQRIAAQLRFIRHWVVIHGSYAEAGGCSCGEGPRPGSQRSCPSWARSAGAAAEQRRAARAAAGRRSLSHLGCGRAVLRGGDRGAPLRTGGAVLRGGASSMSEKRSFSDRLTPLQRRVLVAMWAGELSVSIPRQGRMTLTYRVLCRRGLVVVGRYDLTAAGLAAIGKRGDDRRSDCAACAGRGSTPSARWVRPCADCLGTGFAPAQALGLIDGESAA